MKFGDRIKVAVGEERALAISNILHYHPNTEVILLDDAFQHRSVTPSLNILLTDYHRPFYEDFLLPAGRLRESRTGAGRADIVIVTKCPQEITDEDMIDIEKSIREFVEKPVFFTQIRYGNPSPVARTDIKLVIRKIKVLFQFVVLADIVLKRLSIRYPGKQNNLIPQLNISAGDRRGIALRMTFS